MCSLPAFANNIGANGPFIGPLSSSFTLKKSSKGFTRSSKNYFKLPVNIFSNPKAIEQFT